MIKGALFSFFGSVVICVCLGWWAIWASFRSRLERNKDAIEHLERDKKRLKEELEQKPPPVDRIIAQAKPKKEPNVKFMGFWKTDGAKDRPRSFLATFENYPIPNESIADFLNAKAKVELFYSDDGYTVVMPCKWVDNDYLSVNLTGGCPRMVMLAMCESGKWKAQKVVERPSSWGSIYETEELDLAPGDYRALVTLIGSQNLSTSPVEVRFTISDDGQLDFTPQSVSYTPTLEPQ